MKRKVVKRRKTRARKVNPAPLLYIITAQSAGERMSYVGMNTKGVPKFSNTSGRVTLFKTVADARKCAVDLIVKFPMLRKYQVRVETNEHKPGAIPAARKNPSKRKSKVAQKVAGNAGLRQASRLLKDFSGHEPCEILKIPTSKKRTGLVVGETDGILYTTVRDGRTEKYIHKFKKSSRPLLIASSDGTELGIVGGQFQFTEAGIEDR